MATRQKKVCYSRAQLQLRNRFRLLWEQHVYWTRMVILAIAFDSPTLEPTVARLLRNVPDFEATLRRFYKPDQVQEFGRLLNDHLVIAADLVTAAKAGDNEAVAELEKSWYANADEIVRQMQRMNPFWRASVQRPLWQRHLALTLEEAVQTLSGRHAESIATFDEVEKEALMMADSMAKGIIRQFRL